MKRGPYNKPGREMVVKYCPCENEAMKEKGVYVKDQGSYICRSCKERESRFPSTEWSVAGRLGARVYSEKSFMNQENALTD